MRLLLLISILNLSPVAFGADCPTEKVSDKTQRKECEDGTAWHIYEVETDSNAANDKKTECLTPAQARAKGARPI